MRKSFVRKSFVIALLAAAFAVAGAARPGWAEDAASVVGLWKLIGYEVEVQATGQKGPVMGDHPTGYALFTPDGRVFFMLTGEGRMPARTAEERAALLTTMVAYTGRYRLEGDKWITNVEVAWNPEWVGSEQSRTYKIENGRLQVLTPWRIMPNWADKGMQRSIVTFQKAE
jgi:hypothetical protein